MMGDVKPEVLRTVVLGRDKARAELAAPKSKAKAKASKPKKKGGDELSLLGSEEEASSEDLASDELVGLEAPGENPIVDAQHVLGQEIDRLKKLRSDLPLTPDEKTAKAIARTSVEEYGVTLVPVKLKGGQWTLVSYGELNTLADYYGGPEEIAKTDPGNFRAIILGIRERELRGFVQILGELEGKKADKAKEDSYADDLKFEGAIGDTGRKSPIKGVSDADYAELTLMGKVPFVSGAKSELPDEPESSYASGLARNACHFAPYSWHAWADYHGKAEALAKKAFASRGLANAVNNPFVTEEDRPKHKADAEEFERQALIQNGFGDHFLQDSFASGHLINKTLIMTWFAKYLDQHPFREDFSSKEDWRQVQSVVYAQDPKKAFGNDLYKAPVGGTASTDPQTAENTPGSWQARFTALGLSVPASVRDPGSSTAEVLRDWQTQAAADPSKATRSGKQLYKMTRYVDMKGLSPDLQALIADGVVVRVSSYKRFRKDTDLSGDTTQIGKAQERETDYQEGDTFALRREYIPTRGKQPSEDENERTTQLESVTHRDFLKFINHSYLQFSTNVLHNEFCASGLGVKSGDGTDVMRVYGDNALLNQGAAEGVAYAAETSRRSFQSIKDLASKPEASLGADLTMGNIDKRLPKSVEPPEGGLLTLADWHKQGGVLQGYCDSKLFPKIASAWNAKSSLVGAGGTVGKVVSKDEGAHGKNSSGELF